MKSTVEIRTYLDDITQDIEEVKKMLIPMEISNKNKTEKAWNDLMNLSKKISKQWKGPNAAEEIKDQREKTW